MTINITETETIYFLEVNPQVNFMGAVSRDNQTFTYRFAYLASNTPFDPDDRKNWYRFTGKDAGSAAEEATKTLADEIEKAGDPRPTIHRLERNELGDAEFAMLLQGQPWANSKRMPK